MSKSLNKILATLIIPLASIQAYAQNGINSPYSRYGFGVQAERSMGFNKGMGGVAQGFRDGEIVNVANPASYSAVDSLTALFDLGVSFHNANLKMGNLQQNAKNTTLDHVAFHFRATKGLGIAAGILPYTNINYNFTSPSEDLAGTENITSSYAFGGDGGLHQVFLGAGWQVFKPLSIGFNASYLYGDYKHSMTMSYNESGSYSIVRGYKADINTYMMDFGLQYTQKLSKKNGLTLGLSYSLGHEVKNSAIRYTQTIATSSIEGFSSDTIKNAFELPHTFAGGLTYTSGKNLSVGADVEYQKWSKCKFPSQDLSNATSQYVSGKGLLNDRIKYAVGASYTPDPMARSYGQRITYKVGGYFAQPYAKADMTGIVNDKPTEFGLSAGLTLPIQNKNLWYNSPKINLSVQWVHTNIPYLSTLTMKKDNLKENFLRLTVGITFSERWFYKWKVQ